MTRGKFNAAYVHKRTGEIQCSIEMLNYGLSELEAIYQRIKFASTMSEGERDDAKASAVELTEKNYCLAKAIHKALREVESNLKLPMDNVTPNIDQDAILEFSSMLKESIRTLTKYYEIHKTYMELRKAKMVSGPKIPPLPLPPKKKRSRVKVATKKDADAHSPSTFQRFRRLVRTICICGGKS